MPAALLAALLILTAPILVADRQIDPPLAPSAVPIQRYGEGDRTCLAWSDRCRNCSRRNGVVTCSNIGIACQPGKIECMARRGQ